VPAAQPCSSQLTLSMYGAEQPLQEGQGLDDETKRLFGSI
jgi:hypothetical protein